MQKLFDFIYRYLYIKKVIYEYLKCKGDILNNKYHKYTIITKNYIDHYLFIFQIYINIQLLGFNFSKNNL